MIRTDMAKSVADRIQVRLYNVHCTLYSEQLAPYTIGQFLRRSTIGRTIVTLYQSSVDR